jgi:glucosamine--fructose-6-phosphate aminotransferase (isomerizing)
MRETVERQPADLRALLEDRAPVEAVAERLRGRRLLLVGTGTSWHAANHGAWFLRKAGVEAWPLQAMDVSLEGALPGEGDGLLLLSHRNTKRYTSEVVASARERGVACVAISGRGAPGADIETVEQERSAAFTASHLGAIMRLAQLSEALGADLGGLEGVPDAVASVLEGPSIEFDPPKRLLEFTGAGPNQWTAAEGALKVRETSYVATEGLSVEQLLHGPSVALGTGDALVCLDGGGPGARRLAAVADAAEACGVRVHRIAEGGIGEPLSVFPLTVHVQRIALELAEALGTNPDTFGFDVPGRKEAWGAIEL